MARTRPKWKRKWLEKMHGDADTLAWYNELTRLRKIAKMYRRDIRRVRTSEWAAILLEFSNVCAICRVEPATTIGFVLHPYRGGNFEPNNLQPVCTECDGKKEKENKKEG
ncbi:HNH endonuclease [Candidatus Pacearchaeota archaeon]|nr:HNH endonuclease [Candidatus Pacearchaeota archaeon]